MTTTWRLAPLSTARPSKVPSVLLILSAQVGAPATDVDLACTVQDFKIPWLRFHGNRNPLTFHKFTARSFT